MTTKMLDESRDSEDFDLNSHVLAVLTGRLVAAGEAEGLNGDALLADARLTRADIRDPDRYLPLKNHVELGRSMARRLGPKNGGLHSGASIYGDPRGALGYAIRRSGTHEGALRHFCRFLSLSNPSSPAWIQESEDGIEFRVDMASGLAQLGHPIESLLSAWVAMARFVTGLHIIPRRVSFVHRPHGPVSEHAEFFGCNVDFEADHSGMVFDRTTARAAIDRTSHPYDALLKQVEAEFLKADERSVTDPHPEHPACAAFHEIRTKGTIFDVSRHDRALLGRLSAVFLQASSSVPRFEVAFLFGFPSVLALNAALGTGR